MAAEEVSPNPVDSSPCQSPESLSCQVVGRWIQAYTSAGEDTFAVPTGATQVSVVAIGGGGGAGGSLTGSTFVTGAAGGSGAEATAAVPMPSGSTVYVEVGSKGADATGNPSINTCGPGAAGVNAGIPS